MGISGVSIGVSIFLRYILLGNRQQYFVAKYGNNSTMHGWLLIAQAGQQSRSSDDGEPHGTAGRPILEAIRGEGLDYTAVLVTRYV